MLRHCCLDFNFMISDLFWGRNHTTTTEASCLVGILWVQNSLQQIIAMHLYFCGCLRYWLYGFKMLYGLLYSFCQQVQCFRTETLKYSFCLNQFLSFVPPKLNPAFPLLSLCRWIPQCQHRPLHLFISSLQLAALISPLHVNRSWSAHAQLPSTHPTWLLPQSQSVWVPVSLAPVSIWKALYGKKQRTVRGFREHFE